jgi:hypothetical protein
MSSMRIIAIGLLCFLASCPAPSRPAGAPAPAGLPAAGPNSAGGGGTAGVQAFSWPQEALAYLQQSLEHPTAEGNSPLGPVCQVVAQFPQAGTDPAFAAVRQAVLRWRGQMGESVASEIVAAWLAIEPGPASDQIVKRIAKGEDAVFQGLSSDAAAGRAVLERVDQAKLTPIQASRVLDLLRIWGGAQAKDKKLLEVLAKREPVIGWRALGYLVKLFPEDETYFKKLDAAIRNAKPAELSAAVEAAKISGDAKVADALVLLVAHATLGPERVDRSAGAAGKPDAKKAAAPGKPQPSSPQHDAVKVALGAYAFAYLPGDQAQYARRKLLEAADPLLRWQARLGELLHGDAKPWNDAVQAQGVEQSAMWVVLEPPEAWEAALIPTYAKAAQSKDGMTRGKSALQLNRYASCESDRSVLATLSRLASDTDPDVRETAWYTLGKLRLDPTAADPLTVVNDAQAPAGVRLAAAYTALRLAGPPAAK